MFLLQHTLSATTNKKHLMQQIICILSIFCYLNNHSYPQFLRYLITKQSLLENKIYINEYLKNTGDSLKLKRSILKKLEQIKYPYIIDFKLNIDKNKCKNRLTSKLFYEKMTEEYNNKLKT